jgi:hypothetical protein
VLAISEPEFDSNQQPVCTRGSCYHAVYYGGRAALYINKRWPVSSVTQWKQDGGIDWCSVTFLGQDPWTVYSVYSPNNSPEWTSPLTDLTRRTREGRSLVVGDFNLYHPMWDREGRQSRHCDAALTLAGRWEMDLLTPWGVTTRKGKPGERDSTIDLAWGLANLQGWHAGINDVEGSDHVAQVIHIEEAITQRPPGEASTQFSWALLDREWEGSSN